MVNAKNVLKTICFALFLLFAAGLTIGHYSGFWPRLRIFWHLDSQIPAVQAAMKEYLQKKYDENFEVERPEILYDLYGYRLSTKASPADNPDLKFDIRTDHYRFRDPFHPEDLFKNFRESFSLSRWGFREIDFTQRLIHALQETVSEGKAELLKKQYLNFANSERIVVFVKSIEGTEKNYKNLNLFQIFDKDSREKRTPNVYYEAIIYTDFIISKIEEAEKFCSLLNEHLNKCRAEKFIIAVLYYWHSKKKEVERGLRGREKMMWKPGEWKKKITEEQATEISSASYRYSRFREALDADYKTGKLKNAFIISSYDCQGGAISKEQIIKSFLY